LRVEISNIVYLQCQLDTTFEVNERLLSLKYELKIDERTKICHCHCPSQWTLEESIKCDKPELPRQQIIVLF